MQMLLVLFLALFSTLSCSLSSSSPSSKSPQKNLESATVTFSNEVYSELYHAWDSVDSMQVERVYCIDRYSYKVTNDTAEIRVEGIRPGVVIEATPNSIRYKCRTIISVNGLPYVQYLPTIHTHPPSNCTADGKKCVYSDWRRYDCLPSTQDRITAYLYRLDFAVVQCWNNSFALYGVSVS